MIGNERIRGSGLCAMALVAVAACGRSSGRAHETTIARDDAAKAATPVADAVSDAGSTKTFLDGLDPSSPAPAPISRKTRRGDCKTAYAPRPARDPNPMCRVDGGTFMYGGGRRIINGTRDPAPPEVHVPAVQVSVHSFLIDQFEVTAAQAALFLNTHGNVCEGLDKKQNPGDVTPCVWIEPELAGIEMKNGRFVTRPGQEQVREGYFTWEGALRYCAWAGKRVPSSAQWEYAARHDAVTGRDLVYPWGDSWVAHAAACNAKPCDSNPHGRTPFDRRLFPVATFDGTHGRADSSSPWGLHDVAGGGDELVFECANPEATCEAGGACGCKVLFTSGDHAPNIEWLRLDHRIDDTAFGSGVGSVRCAADGR